MNNLQKVEVLFERNGVLAINKPAGLPTQAPWDIESVECRIRRRNFHRWFEEALASGETRHPGGFLGVPHRLDRAVSGVMLLALTPRAARQLSRQFERRQIQKTYVAIVEPTGAIPISEEPFMWQDSLRKVSGEPRVEVMTLHDSQAKFAQTTGFVLASSEGRYLLKLHPETGRMHQLRIQAACRGVPIVNDALYGSAQREDIESIRHQPIALHAWSIEYDDPETKQRVAAHAPVPETSLWMCWRDAISSCVQSGS
ncbi:MAG: RluA family pseudouridine synthase [Pirellulales bacterium]|nr:RluA family pseudouridine synthase [Pirellulales bacterium]